MNNTHTYLPKYYLFTVPLNETWRTDGEKQNASQQQVTLWLGRLPRLREKESAVVIPGGRAQRNTLRWLCTNECRRSCTLYVPEHQEPATQHPPLHQVAEQYTVGAAPYLVVVVQVAVAVPYSIGEAIVGGPRSCARQLG